MPSAVCDAGPLIHLAEISRSSLLAQFSPLFVPVSVVKEVRGFVPRLPVVRKVAVTQAQRQHALARSRVALHAGELDCLAVCLRRPRLVFLTDDWDARDAATRMGIETHGSVGIIVRACRVGLLDGEQAEATLRMLNSVSSLFIASEIIELAIEQLRKHK
jgi:predicted nucleic acid-binding protein